MLSVVCWKWGRGGQQLFGPEYVNVLQEALRRHLHLPHELVCVTDDPSGIDQDLVRVVPMPQRFAETPRCRRRMQNFDREWGARVLGSRILNIDLDVVIVGDITPIVDRTEPVVGWKVGHAGVYSGSFLLFDAGALHGAWEKFSSDPGGFPLSIGERGVHSDQAMFNHYLRLEGVEIAEWTEADGLVTYYGDGYERLEHLGVGPRHQKLPPGARIVVLGSADKAVMDESRYPWVRRHWTALRGPRGGMV